MKKAKLMSVAAAGLMIMAAAAPVTAFAENPTNGATKTTAVQYEVKESEWTWTVPAAQTFTLGTLETTGAVKILPSQSGDVIALADGTSVSIAVYSNNDFRLKNTDASTIAYQVMMNDVALTQNAEVLKYVAGTSANTGVSQDLKFVTTAENIKAATLSGSHHDLLTWTMTITKAGTQNAANEENSVVVNDSEDTEETTTTDAAAETQE